MIAGKYEMDMCRGPLTVKIIRYALPLIFTGILQLAFSMVDMLVIGRFAAHESMAAIGSTTNIISLLIFFFQGLAAGSNILMARHYGENDRRRMHACVHTSVWMACTTGIALLILGELVALPMLRLCNVPANVVPEAHRYLAIYFLATPGIMLGSFGTSLLMAVGDTKRPLFYYVIAGTINAVLDLILVVWCGMTVGGVAIATVASQLISALLILRAIIRSRGGCRLIPKKIRPDWGMCGSILKIGLPAAIENSLFSVSNLAIDTVINSFGSYAIAGSAAARTMEDFVYVGSGTCQRTALSFVAQNLGGGKPDRVRKSFRIISLSGFACCLTVGLFFLTIGREVLGVFTHDDAQVIEWGLLRMHFFPLYCFCALMDSSSGTLRGLGYSFLAASSTVIGVCGFRFFWIFVILPLHRTFSMLFLCYPISWILVVLFNWAMIHSLLNRKVFRRVN